MQAKEKEEQLWMQAKEQEEQLWSLMSAADAKKMQSMLQAASLYQQQLQQNESTIANLQDQAVPDVMEAGMLNSRWSYVGRILTSQYYN